MLIDALNQVTPWLVDVVTTILVGVILALGKRAFTWLGRRIKSEELVQQGQQLENDAKVREYLNEALSNGIKKGLAYVRATAAANMVGQPPDRSREIATQVAVDYTRNRVQGALDHFGVDDEGLRELVQARLPER